VPFFMVIAIRRIVLAGYKHKYDDGVIN